jgi:signal transduction histidine kinase
VAAECPARPGGCSERILILAPVGRDAVLAQEILSKAGIVSQICADMDQFCRDMLVGAGALLLAQEALAAEDTKQLLDTLAIQPRWSDLGLVVLVSGGATTSANVRLVTRLGPHVNVTFLERPVRTTTLTSAARAALRMRRRQYELRDHLQARSAAEEAERQARVRAEDAARIRDEFLTSVVHDLKNPLGAIKGYAQLLQRRAAKAESPEAAKLVEGLTKIDTMITKAIAQIDELLDLARLQADQPLPLNLQPTDLVALVHRAAAEYQQMSTRHRIRVEEDLPELYGIWDALRLERLLGNLLSNAIKYSPDGGEIIVKVGQEDGETNGVAILVVSDQGIGIPAADLPHIFDRFYRAANAIGRLPGNGLGLAGGRQIVEQHGGTIVAESQEGAGTTFTVRLPIIEHTD